MGMENTGALAQSGSNAKKRKGSGQPLTLEEFTAFLEEVRDQPAWRTQADKEMDYCDGNQLGSTILKEMEALGIPPAIEPLIGPILDGVLGLEIKSRGDWKVSAQEQNGADDLAEAMNFKLHEAETRSGADVACSEAFDSQVKVGLGWVYVGREQNPFKACKYRVESVHRNEISFDWHARPDQSDARFLIRRKWLDKRVAELTFPDKAELIRRASSGWMGIDLVDAAVDGSEQPSLYASAEQERGSSIDQQHWLDTQRARVCLFECWYRRWELVTVVTFADGRVIEYDSGNAAHVIAVAQGIAKPQKVLLSRVRVSWWMGPHRLSDEPSPHSHDKFPYIPFWGKREDRTGAPFALVRGMIYLQDQVNALHSSQQWLMAARRVVRTAGVVLDNDEDFRNEVARKDADIVLDPKALREGGIFRVEQDLELNAQQFSRLEDTRAGLRRVGGVYSEFEGHSKSAQSGVQFNSQVEQSNQALAAIRDHSDTARAEVGDQLMSMIIEDMIGKQESVILKGNGIVADRTIHLNEPAIDEDAGYQYLNNDVQRAKLKVGVSDVPSSTTFKQQQLQSLSVAFQAASPRYQAIIMPHMLSLMDIPNREALVQAIKEADDAPTPEQVQEQIKQAVDQAVQKQKMDMAIERMMQQQPLIDAQVRKVLAEAANSGVEGIFSATEAAKNLALSPGLAPVADQIARSADIKDHDAAPLIAEPAMQIAAAPPLANTNPMTPANPAVGMMAGIEGGA